MQNLSLFMCVYILSVLKGVMTINIRKMKDWGSCTQQELVHQYSGWCPYIFTVIDSSTHTILTLQTVIFGRKHPFIQLTKVALLVIVVCLWLPLCVLFFLFVLFYISAFPCSFCSLGADSCVAKAFFPQQMLRCRRNPCTSLHPAAPAVRQFTSAYYLVVALRWSVY